MKLDSLIVSASSLCANLETRVGQYVMILDYDWTLLGSLKNNVFSFPFSFVKVLSI